VKSVVDKNLCVTWDLVNPV